MSYFFLSDHCCLAQLIFLGLGISGFSACNQAPILEVEPAKPTVQTVALEQLPDFAQTIATVQLAQHQAILNWTNLRRLPMLPSDASKYAAQHLDAALAGKKRLLAPYYRHIYAPTQHQTRHLDLSFQNLPYLPDHICRYQDLRYLSLSNNQLKAINPLLAQNQYLRKLDLSSNGFQHLPKGLLRLTQLQELVLADNALYSLPNSFTQLRQLRVLDIGNLHHSSANHYNNFQRLPNILLNMPQLRKLFLDKLPLQVLPNRLPQMRNLRVVSLNGNRLLNWTQAFQVLANMPQLLALDISFIGRQNLPSNIQQLRHLKILIWHEEGQRNRAFVENTLKAWLPNTKIYYGKEGIATPFLRGNSIATIEKIARE